MDGRTDRQTDGRDNNITFAFLKKHGDNYSFPFTIILFPSAYRHT